MKEKQLFGKPKYDSLQPVPFYKIQPAHEFLGRILAGWDRRRDNFTFTTKDLKNFTKIVCASKDLYPQITDGFDMDELIKKFEKERIFWDFIQRAKRMGAIVKIGTLRKTDGNELFKETIYQIVNTNWVLLIRDKKSPEYDPSIVNGIIARGIYSTIMMFPETVTPVAVVKKLPKGCFTAKQMIDKFRCLSNPKQNGPTCLKPLPKEKDQPSAYRHWLITDRSYSCNPLSSEEWKIFCRKRGVDTVDWPKEESQEKDKKIPPLFENTKDGVPSKTGYVQVPKNPTYQQLKEAGAIIPKDVLADGFFLSYLKMKRDLFKANQTIEKQKDKYDHDVGELEAERDMITEEYNEVIDKIHKKDEEIKQLREEKDNEIKRLTNVVANTEAKYEHDLKRVRERNSFLEQRCRENGNGDGAVNLADL